MVLTLIIGWSCLVGFNGCVADHLLLHPSTHAINPLGAKRRVIDADNQTGASHAPAVFVTGTSDSLVPAFYQQKVIDAYGGEKRTMTYSGGHNDMPDVRDPRFGDAVEWLWSQRGH